MLKRLVFPCGLLILMACGGGGAATGARSEAPLEPLSSDSGGVQILAHGADAFERAPAMSIDSAPTALIRGSAESVENDISTIGSYLFLADGRLAGVDQQRQVLVVFGPDGTGRREFGRKGAGPGEFGSVGDVVGGGGDTLLLNDYGNGRASEVVLSSGAIRDIPLSAAMGAGGRSLAGRVGENLLLWSPSFPSPDDENGPMSPGVKGVWFSPRSGEARRVFTTGPEEAPERRIAIDGGGMVAVRAIRVTALSAFPEVLEWQGEYLILDPNRWRIERRDTAGALRSVVTIAHARRPVTPAIWNAYVDKMVLGAVGRMSRGGMATASATINVSGGGPGGQAPDTNLIRRNISGQRHADSLPAFERAQVTPNGTLWLLDYPVPGDSGWAATAIDPAGRILGRLVKASGDAPVAFGDDRVAFRSEDADGIATITVRRIRFVP